MLTVEQAKAKILEGAEAVAEVEDMVTLYSAGKILAQDIVSEIKVPPLDNSQMDGYAVRCADFAGGRRNFPVSQRIFAGHVGTELEPDTVARIFTGAPIPPGADAVIPQEEASEMEDGSVEFHCDPKAGAWIRRAGCDIDVGQTVLKKGDRLTPPALGVAASIGVSTVKVYRPIRVSLFFTGDELAMPGEKLVEGGIYNSNRFVLRGLLHQLGCDVVDYGNIPDTFEATLEAFRKASRKSDFILTSGGMSVGEADFIRRAVEELGKMQMWRIAMKPGKPVAKGEVRGVPFIGLPGNPVSGFVTFLLFAQPLILKLSGRGQIDVKGYILPLAFDYKCGSRREFIRVRRNGAGELENYRTQNSAVLSSCTWADGLADIPAEADLKKGDLVTYIPFSEFNLEEASMKIAVQTEDFDVQAEVAALHASPKVGAVVMFLGTVRDLNEGDEVASMTLEHYPGMTEKALTAIVEEAKKRWDIMDATVIHRVGELFATDQIVFVGVSGAHRGEAFKACEFIIDYLKTEAPFWKKEKVGEGTRWVQAKETDEAATSRWTK